MWAYLTVQTLQISVVNQDSALARIRRFRLRCTLALALQCSFMLDLELDELRILPEEQAISHG